MQGGICVVDFGSQLTQLIARRYRELGFYSEIVPYNASLERIKELAPKGIVLSGGPSSVFESDSPYRDVKELLSIAPLFGICYGMQILVHQFGGKVEKASQREYGFNEVFWEERLGKISSEQRVWMSHGDIVREAPPDIKIVARSASGHPAAIKGERIWAVQFHPEVSHTEQGTEVLRAFAEFCGAASDWDAPHITEHLKELVQAHVPDGEHVLVGLSGGVDSSVVATLLTQALGADRVHCVFVDNGLLRHQEYEDVLKKYEAIGLNVKGVPAKDLFLAALRGIDDPELKRKAIGRVFIEVFDGACKELPKVQWLAQGTLYPDVIESVSPRGGSVTIKSHHNVGGLPEKMKLKLVEPLRELFKDEVRAIGKELGLPEEMLWRHPFPGPGLAIRILGEVNEESLRIVKEADHLFIQALKREGLYDKIWQAFCVLLPIKSVGVQGDARTYDQVLALRAVTSNDGMTADWFHFDFDFLRRISNKITNEVDGVNRVVYDITSKPPGTIEWE